MSEKDAEGESYSAGRCFGSGILRSGSRRALDHPDPSPTGTRGWFADKVDFRVPMPATIPELEFAGGRLCNILDQRVASFMYQSDGAWVSLYVMKSVHVGAIDGKDDETTLKGYAYIGWTSGGLRYSLIGDISNKRLRRVVDNMRPTWTTAVRTRRDFKYRRS